MLPTAKTPPRASLNDITILIYGPPKIGKSTFCAEADGALFAATEPGLNNLEVFRSDITSWPEFLKFCAALATEEHDFKTVIVDTVDNLYRYCSDFICQREKVSHESDLEYGKGYALVNNEFHRVLTKLAMTVTTKGHKIGLWLVSHSQEKEFKTRTGNITRVVPTLPEKARRVVNALVDVILFCDLDTSEGKPRRVVRTKPSTHYEAGDRTKALPETVDLDFQTFRKAYLDGKARQCAEAKKAQANGAQAAKPADAKPEPAPAAATK